MDFRRRAMNVILPVFNTYVIEPWGSLRGIRDVRVENVSPAFAVKLTMALKSSEVVCRLAEELYRKQVIKVKGGKKPRICKERKYLGSRYIRKPDFPPGRESEMDIRGSQVDLLSEI